MNDEDVRRIVQRELKYQKDKEEIDLKYKKEKEEIDKAGNGCVFFVWLIFILGALVYGFFKFTEDYNHLKQEVKDLTSTVQKDHK